MPFSKMGVTASVATSAKTTSFRWFVAGLIFLIYTGGQFGGACAPLLVGLLLDSYGWDYVFGFMGLGSLVSFVIVATIKEPLASLNVEG